MRRTSASSSAPAGSPEHALCRENVVRASEPLLMREADVGRAFRLIGIGAHDLVEAGGVVQRDLFGGVSPNAQKIDGALDAVREKFVRQGLSKADREERRSNGSRHPSGVCRGILFARDRRRFTSRSFSRGPFRRSGHARQGR